MISKEKQQHCHKKISRYLETRSVRKINKVNKIIMCVEKWEGTMTSTVMSHVRETRGVMRETSLEEINNETAVSGLASRDKENTSLFIRPV